MTAGLEDLTDLEKFKVKKKKKQSKSNTGTICPNGMREKKNICSDQAYKVQHLIHLP